jgi:hypothetical protein
MRQGTIYSLHPSFAMEETSLRNLKERTGKTLEQWIAFMKKNGPATEKDRREWLKKEHGLTTNYCWWIAERAEGRGAAADYDPDTYVGEMFQGKEHLRPVYDKLLKFGMALGKDVKACPCQTIVPLYRENVFAQLKPTTKTRIDLGLCLRNIEVPERLIDTGGQAKGDRITHRIPIAAMEDIDKEVETWFRRAYDLAGSEATNKPKPAMRQKVKST